MDWTKVIEAFICLLITIVIAVIIPYVKAKIGAESFDEVKKWVKVAVQAAELIYKEAGMGEMKKKYVEAFISDLHLEITQAQLDTLIESAVLELKKGLSDVAD